MQHDQKIGAEGAFPTEQSENVVFDFAVGAAHGFLMGKRIVAAVIVVAEKHFGKVGQLPAGSQKLPAEVVVFGGRIVRVVSDVVPDECLAAEHG